MDGRGCGGILVECRWCGGLVVECRWCGGRGLVVRGRSCGGWEVEWWKAVGVLVVMW